ncbi:MAG: esterase [Pseudomonadales bacterium]
MYQPLDVPEQRTASPSPWHSALELPRVLLEVCALGYSWPLLGGDARGDGHPVLVLPGFTAGDESTVVLRRYLSRLGYEALPWQLGQNTGRFELQERLLRHFERLTRSYSRRISLIGQSLGGVFAREVARQFPEQVRQVITLGSPFSSSGPETTNAIVGRLFRYMSGMSHNEMRDYMLEFPQTPPPVPSTAIYSKTDGVVHWSGCLEYPGDQAENVEVYGSHTGMAVNPLVLHVIADRLGQREGAWRPFQRKRGLRALMYPEPEVKEVTCASSRSTRTDACTI